MRVEERSRLVLGAAASTATPLPKERWNGKEVTQRTRQFRCVLFRSSFLLGASFSIYIHVTLIWRVNLDPEMTFLLDFCCRVGRVPPVCISGRIIAVIVELRLPGRRWLASFLHGVIKSAEILQKIISE
jgi:hypothetical protein